MTDYKVERLADLAVFESLTRQELERLAGVADEVAVAAGTELVVRDEATNDFYLIERGTALGTNGFGGEVVLEAGDAFGEMPLTHSHSAPGRETIVARTELRLLVIRRPAFELLRESVPGLSGLLPRSMELHVGTAPAGV
ncbi:MAG: cyclic nucleotide-binding domain-containing protein [Dehalococcoidia bacterium]